MAHVNSNLCNGFESLDLVASTERSSNNHTNVEQEIEVDDFTPETSHELNQSQTSVEIVSYETKKANQEQIDMAQLEGMSYDEVHNLIPPELININLVLQQLGDFQMLVELLDCLLADRDSSLQKVEAAIEANDFRQLAFEAHAIKSPSLSLHLTQLGSAAYDLEQIGNKMKKFEEGKIDIAEDERTSMLANRMSFLNSIIDAYVNVETLLLPICKKLATLEEEEDDEDEYESGEWESEWDEDEDEEEYSDG